MSTYFFHITIDKTKVSGTNTNFVYLFSEDCASIPSTFWDHIVNASGLDIRFFEQDNVTELKRIIIYYDSANKKIEARIQIPYLTDDTDAIICCRYGGDIKDNDMDTFPATDRYYPLQTTTPSDYGPNANTGTGNNVTADAGKVGKGNTFNGSSSSLNGTGLSFALKPNFTFALWFKTSAMADVEFLSKGRYVGLSDKDVTQLGIYGNGKIFYDFEHNSIVQKYGSTSVTYNDGNWHHVAFVYENEITFYLYIDGEYYGTYDITGASSVLFDSVSNATIGDWILGGFSVNGMLDCIRLCTRVFSSDEIKTIYNNENAPSTFSSCGTEQPFSIEIDVTPNHGEASLAVQFNSYMIGLTISKYLWAFGDGQLSTSSDPDHIYKEPGTYSVRFWAWTTLGGYVYLTLTVTVTDGSTPRLDIYDSQHVEEGIDLFLEQFKGKFQLTGVT